MKIKDLYSEEDVLELFEELTDLGVDLDELPGDITLIELVRMSNRLRS